MSTFLLDLGGKWNKTFNFNLQNKIFQFVESVAGHVSWVCLMMMWMRPLPGRPFPTLMQPLRGRKAFWELFGHDLRGDVRLVRSLPVRWELGTGGTWMADPSSSNSSSSRGHNQTQPFGFRMLKYFALTMSEKCILHRHLSELSISWETLAIQAFCSWWKQMGNGRCFSGSESMISCCAAAWAVSTSKATGKRFSLSYVTPLLVTLHRRVQSTSWPWHHATENRLMRQRKRGWLFCREAGSDHLVAVKTDHTELFCFVRAEFHSVTACLSDIL